ncbi:MAG: UDP-N-acetylglucosamine 1-carboxyvinyltransferase [Alphaproteobacteria bacterium]|nr:MAG: UDP-N-acetylglucosamine 1-carboxyvinyltransferase [Alphaproteobacteria bacterium]
MDKLCIEGGVALTGVIPVSGAKNAALPLLVAGLMSDEPLVLENVPAVADILTMRALLEQHGVGVEQEAPGIWRLHARQITNITAPYDLVRKMRASIWVLGALMARCGKARVSLPGGCSIGTRPVDLHLQGLRAMGAQIELKDGYIEAQAPQGLRGAEIVFPFVSVGATINLLMAASLAKGETTLINAAREPEVCNLAECLVAMGAQITGIGGDRLHIVGVDRLHGARHGVIPDRIEAGTWAVAAAITGGDLLLQGARADHLEAFTRILNCAGVLVTEEEGGLRVRRANGALTGADVMTEPYPGYPTDLQAQMMALMTVAQGAALITETIFENRFMHVPELARMGANITVHTASALVRGVPVLKGAPVMATDLRASVSLVLAGLAAQGRTTVRRVYHLDRGYERIEEKLVACGARIERLKGDDEE